jgi:colanic acid/amylovoran biosynthesis glycosyltransferase
MPGQWALHLGASLGNLTDRWIDLQVTSGRRYPGRLLGYEVSDQADGRRPHWVNTDRPDLRLASRGMWRLDGWSTRWLARPFADDPPSVVHAHYGVVAATHRHVARALGRPLVASFYGRDATAADFVGTARWRRRYRRLFAEVGAVVCEGPAMAARVAALGCPEELLRVVRLPADADGLAGVVRRPDPEFTVAVAGRWAAKKGFDTAIRAFARGLRDRPRARLLLIGGGELEGEYRRIVDGEGIAGRVEWSGRLPFAEFMATIARAHVALYPSRTAPDGDSEGGAPVTLIESQWLGVPAVVSDHDDLPFVAAPGALVLPPTDVSVWADVLRTLHDDPSALAQMAEQAERFARSAHSPAANAEARERVYDEVRA